MSRPLKLVSWNVNGLRSVLKKTFRDFLRDEAPDVVCLQETRAQPDDVEPGWAGNYQAHWNPAVKRGYSGTVVLSRAEVREVTCGIGRSEHDHEGRVLTVDLGPVRLVNVYVPNSQRELTRLPYRQDWDRAFLQYLTALAKRGPVVVCGDFNVAHTEIDLANPKANVRNHGFTAEERAGFSALIEAGFIDTFREFEKAGGHYTWWSPMAGARARNVGWRIDYFLVSSDLRPRLKQAFIRSHVLGSDHCPIGIELAESRPTSRRVSD